MVMHGPLSYTSLQADLPYVDDLDGQAQIWHGQNQICERSKEEYAQTSYHGCRFEEQ